MNYHPMMKTVGPTKFYVKTVFLTFIIVTAALSILNLYSGGLKKMISDADISAVSYKDFIGYYYPAARNIYSENPTQEGFFYTPTCALLIRAVTTGNLVNSLYYWQVFQHLMLILLIFIPGIYLAKCAQKMSAYYLYLLVMLLSFPVYHNLHWGQISIFITFCSYFSLFLYEKKSEWLSAIILTLAILTKYYAAVVLLYFLAKRRYSYIAKIFICTAILGLLLPAVTLGFEKTIFIYRTVFEEISYAADWVTYSDNSHYLPNVIIRLAGIEASGAARGLLSILSLAICFGLFYKHFSQKNTSDFCSINAASTFLLIPLFFNTSWPHYFVYLPFLIVATLYKTNSNSAKSALIAATVLQTPLIFAVTNHTIYGFYAFLLWSNLIVLALCFNNNTVQS